MKAVATYEMHTLFARGSGGFLLGRHCLACLSMFGGLCGRGPCNLAAMGNGACPSTWCILEIVLMFQDALYWLMQTYQIHAIIKVPCVKDDRCNPNLHLRQHFSKLDMTKHEPHCEHFANPEGWLQAFITDPLPGTAYRQVSACLLQT